MPEITTKETKAPKTPKGNKMATRADLLAGRKVIYPELDAKFFLGEDALGEEQAKEILGWEVIPEEGGKGATALFTDPEGNSVRLTRNLNNRPFRYGAAAKYAQELLNGHWADSRNGGKVTLPLDPSVGGGEAEMDELTLNGETIIVGRTGNVQSGQHRLVGLVFASQLARKEKNALWRERWPDGKVTMEALVVFGTSENHRVTRTLDNVVPRSLTDVLCSDPEFAGKFSQSQREKLARMFDYGIRTLWDATGEKDNPWHPHRTHSEALEYLDRHGRLKKAVLHLYQEYKQKSVRDAADDLKKVDSPLDRIFGAGTAAGLLYLMGCSASTEEQYQEAKDGSRNESKLDWSRWEKATEFWTEIGRGEQLYLALTKTRRPVAPGSSEWDGYIFAGKDAIGGGGSREEKVGVVIKAWNLWIEGDKITPEKLTLEYAKDDSNNMMIATHPDLGGIYLPPTRRKGAEKEEDRDGDKPNPVKERYKALQERKQREVKEGLTPEGRKAAREQNGDSDAAPTGTPTGGIKDELMELRKAHPGYVLFFRTGTGYMLYADDANIGNTLLRLARDVHGGLARVKVPTADFNSAVEKFRTEGHKCATVSLSEGRKVVTYLDEPAPTPAHTEEETPKESPAKKPAKGSAPSPAKPAPKSPPKPSPAPKGKPAKSAPTPSGKPAPAKVGKK